MIDRSRLWNFYEIKKQMFGINDIYVVPVEFERFTANSWKYIFDCLTCGKEFKFEKKPFLVESSGKITTPPVFAFRATSCPNCSETYVQVAHSNSIEVDVFPVPLANYYRHGYHSWTHWETIRHEFHIYRSRKGVGISAFQKGPLMTGDWVAVYSGVHDTIERRPVYRIGNVGRINYKTEQVEVIVEGKKVIAGMEEVFK